MKKPCYQLFATPDAFRTLSSPSLKDVGLVVWDMVERRGANPPADLPLNSPEPGKKALYTPVPLIDLYIKVMFPYEDGQPTRVICATAQEFGEDVLQGVRVENKDCLPLVYPPSEIHLLN